MYYELYIDSLFLLNFVMNLYLLLLVNRATGRTATRLRLVLGAAVGSLAYLLPILLGMTGIFRQMPLAGGALGSILGAALGMTSMICLTFRIRTVGAFFHLAKKLIMYTFLLGGILLFLIRNLPFLRDYLLSVCGICGMGGLGYLFVTFQREQQVKKNHCRCVLIGEQGKLTVSALIDSGNSLVEPISGKPVSIIEKNLFKSLWKEESPYRVIPYTSIGKKRGILQGYLLKELQIETNGVVKSCKDVYVAVSEESLSGQEDAVKIILHPELLA